MILSTSSRSSLFTNDFNYYCSAIILVVPAIFFIVLRLVSINSAMACYLPAELTTSMGYFLHEDCWMKESYSPVFPVPPPMAELIGEAPHITSPHAWLPYLFLVLFLFFTIPQGIRHIAKRNLHFYRSIADERCNADDGKRLAAELARGVEELATQKLRTVIFLLIKSVVFVNYCLQLLYITIFFRDQSRTTAYNSSSGAIIELTYNDEAFPKHLMCNTLVRRSYGSPYRHRIHCSMPINDVYEGYFALICVWFAFAAIVSLCNLVCYAAFCYHSSYTKNILSRILPKEDLDDMVKKVQGTDGLYLLWSISKKEDVQLMKDVILRIRTNGDKAPRQEEGEINNSSQNMRVVNEETAIDHFHFVDNELPGGVKV